MHPAYEHLEETIRRLERTPGLTFEDLLRTLYRRKAVDWNMLRTHEKRI